MIITNEVFGFLGTICTIAMCIPQMVKILKTKSVKDVSVLMFVLSFIAGVNWLIYGILISSLSVVLSSSITSILDIMILILIKIYKK